jgi:hypothetical protein
VPVNDPKKPLVEYWVRFVKLHGLMTEDLTARGSGAFPQRFIQPHTWPATVLVDELDAGCF